MLAALMIPLFTRSSHRRNSLSILVSVHYLVDLNLRLSLSYLLLRLGILGYVSWAELDSVALRYLTLVIWIHLPLGITHGCHCRIIINLLLHRNASVVSFWTQRTQILSRVIMSLTASATAWMLLSNAPIGSNGQCLGLSMFLLTVILLSLVQIHLLLDQLVSMRLSLETAIIILLGTVVRTLHVTIVLTILIVSHAYESLGVLIMVVLWCTDRSGLTIVIHINSSIGRAHV